MRRFLTLVCLLFVAIPAGITVTGCYRNPAGNYCNGLGYGPKVTDLYAITLTPQNTGISLAFGQTRQISSPSATNCKGGTVSVGSYSYGTTNNQLVDISPSGNMCAGTWNRNTGGGIGDYTICNAPSPLPNTNNLPYATAYVTAAAQSVTSNPVQVFVHPQISSISLVGPNKCLSQTQTAQLDAQACYSTVVGNVQTQVLMCAPAGTPSANYACPLPPNVTSVPTCPASIGTPTYTVGTGSVANINSENNVITAELPGTTAITASIAGSGSSAGYFSTCPPASISVSLNGNTTGTVTQGVTQNLVTKVLDTNGNSITGLSLDYQSTNPLDISVSSGGAITASFPGAASVYAICQPGTCNPAPINQVGVNGTGLAISSNAVDLTVPGTASSYVWYGAPGQSQYFVPVELLTGSVGAPVRLPYVPNSMAMDRTATTLYFGSSHELMTVSTSTNTVTGQYPGLPGVVLAVAPNNTSVLVNDQARGVFYLAGTTGTVSSTFGGLAVSAQWTPDSKTLYVTDSAKAGGSHTNTLYVYNANTGWTTYSLATSGGAHGPQSLAITIPGVGAYLSGNPTVAHTWCPTGNPGNYASMVFYPQGDSVNVETDALAATTDGQHILGAAVSSPGPISLSDIDVTIPSGACPAADTTTTPPTMKPLVLGPSPFNQTTLNVDATSVNQVVTSPAAVKTGTSAAAAYSLSFVTYNGSTAGATLPYYTQTVSSTTGLGTVGYVSFAGTNASAITAPIAGAFSPDNTLFFVSTSGDNMVHYISTTTLQDTQQISPNLPACTPVSAGGTDPGCTLAAPSSNPVPATVIEVKPRSTT